MTANELLKRNLDQARLVTSMLLGDLSDADLLVRPVPGANHAAWQLGHLISSEHRIAEMFGAKMPPLPDNFEKNHSKETASSDEKSIFLSKAEYLKTWEEQRKAALATIANLSEADLEKPSPEAFRQFVPKVADLALLLALHEMMHMGQLTTVRRVLGKPHVF